MSSFSLIYTLLIKRYAQQDTIMPRGILAKKAYILVTSDEKNTSSIISGKIRAANSTYRVFVTFRSNLVFFRKGDKKDKTIIRRV